LAKGALAGGFLAFFKGSLRKEKRPGDFFLTPGKLVALVGRD